jgi:hypothetical protein
MVRKILIIEYIQPVMPDEPCQEFPSEVNGNNTAEQN